MSFISVKTAKEIESSGTSFNNPVLRLPYVMSVSTNETNNIKERKFSTDPIFFPLAESSKVVRDTVEVVEKQIQRLSDECGIDLFYHGVTVAGGYILNKLMETRSGIKQDWGSDIDLFFSNPSLRRDVISKISSSHNAKYIIDSIYSISYMLGSTRFDLVRSPIQTPSKLVQRFDLSVCAIAIEFAKEREINIHMTRNFMDSVENMRMRLNNFNLGPSLYKNFDRISKYIRRGFDFPQEDLDVFSRIMVSVPDRDLNEPFPLSREDILKDGWQNLVKERIKNAETYYYNH